MSRSRSKKRKSTKPAGRDNSGKRSAVEDANDVTWIPSTTACYLCHLVKDEDLTILCDGDDCSKEVHMYCLQPPLLCIPSGKWYCDTCSPFGTTKSFLKYLQLHESTKAMYLSDTGIENPDFVLKYQIFLGSLRSRIVRNIEDLRLNLDDEDIPLSEFENLSLVGCRVDIWNSFDHEIHCGRILAERTGKNLETEHLVQFRSGINGRNAPLIVWIVLQEHISVVYRDTFMLRHGHSCLWQPVQCALRSGLYRLYDRRYISSSAHKKVANKRKTVNNKLSKNKFSKIQTSDDSESSDNDNDKSFISKNLSSARTLSSIPSDLAFYSFLQLELIVVESIPLNNCRSLFNWDLHSLRLNKATLYAIMEARAEAEEQISVMEKVKYKSLKELETEGLLDMDNGDVSAIYMTKLSDQYSNWKGITLPFGLSGNSYGNFARKSKSSLLSPEEEQLANFQQDIEVFQQSEKLLIEQRMFLRFKEQFYHASHSTPTVAESVLNEKQLIVEHDDNAYDAIEAEVHSLLRRLCDTVASTVESKDSLERIDKCSSEEILDECNDRMNLEETDAEKREHNESPEQTRSSVVKEDIADRKDDDKNVDGNDELCLNATAKISKDDCVSDLIQRVLDEEKEYETRLACLKQFQNVSPNHGVGSDSEDVATYLLDSTLFLTADHRPQTLQLHQMKSCLPLCDAIDECYRAELAAEQERLEKEKLEQQRLKKIAAAAIRAEKQRKQKEDAEKRRLAAIERKQARELLLKKMYHQDASTYSTSEQLAEQEETKDNKTMQIKEKTNKRSRKPVLAVSEMIVNDIGDTKQGKEDEDNWKLMDEMDIDMEGETWDDAKDLDTTVNHNITAAKPKRLLSELNRIDWFDQIVAFSSFSFSSSASSRVQYGRVVGCDSGMAIVKLSGGVLQQISPLQLEIVEKDSREYIQFSMADALEEDDAEKHQLTHQHPVEDYGDQLLSEPINDFLPADFSFDIANPTTSMNSQQQQPPPQIVKRKPPPPERKVRVIDFAALLTQNEDKDPSAVAQTQKKPARQPLLQAVKLDQISQQKKLGSSSHDMKQKVVDDKETTAVASSQNYPVKSSAPPSHVNPRKQSMFNIEIKKYGRGVGSSSASNIVGSTSVQSSGNVTSVAHEIVKTEDLKSDSGKVTVPTPVSLSGMLVNAAVTTSRGPIVPNDSLTKAATTKMHSSATEQGVSNTNTSTAQTLQESTTNVVYPTAQIESEIKPYSIALSANSQFNSMNVSQSVSQQPSAARKSRFGSRSEVTNVVTSQPLSASYDASQMLNYAHSLDLTINDNANNSRQMEYPVPVMNSSDTNTLNLPYVPQNNGFDLNNGAISSNDIPVEALNNEDSFGNNMYVSNAVHAMDNAFNGNMNQTSTSLNRSNRRSRFSNANTTSVLPQDEMINNYQFPVDQGNTYCSTSDNVCLTTQQQHFDASGDQPISDINIPYSSVPFNNYGMSHNLDVISNSMSVNIANNDPNLNMTSQFQLHAMHGYGDNISDTTHMISMSIPTPHTEYSSFNHPALPHELVNSNYPSYTQNTQPNMDPNRDPNMVGYAAPCVVDTVNYPQYFPDNTDTHIHHNNMEYSSMMYNNNVSNDMNTDAFHHNSGVVDQNYQQAHYFSSNHNVHHMHMTPMDQHSSVDYNTHNIHNHSVVNTNVNNKANRDPRRNRTTNNNTNNNINCKNNNSNASRIVRLELLATDNRSNNNSKLNDKSTNHINNNHININHSNNSSTHDGLTKSERRRLRRQEKQDQFQRSLQQLDEEMHHIGSVLSHDHSNPLYTHTSNDNKVNRATFTIDMVDLEDGEVCEE